MTNGILVLGPESSGTRLLTRCFIAAGCDGDDVHWQRFDAGLPPPERPIVWRRSVPFAGRWPDIKQCVFQIQKAGYAPRAVVITRDWHATSRSQVRAGHVRDVELAEIHLRKAMRHIHMGLAEANILYCWVSYENLVQRPFQTLAWLMCRHDLPVPEVDIYDGNAKYYVESISS